MKNTPAKEEMTPQRPNNLSEELWLIHQKPQALWTDAEIKIISDEQQPPARKVRACPSMTAGMLHNPEK